MGLLSESVEDSVDEAVWVKVKKDIGVVSVVILGVPPIVDVSSRIDEGVICNVLCDDKDVVGDVLLFKDGTVG